MNEREGPKCIDYLWLLRGICVVFVFDSQTNSSFQKTWKSTVLLVCYSPWISNFFTSEIRLNFVTLLSDFFPQLCRFLERLSNFVTKSLSKVIKVAWWTTKRQVSWKSRSMKWLSYLIKRRSCLIWSEEVAWSRRIAPTSVYYIVHDSCMYILVHPCIGIACAISRGRRVQKGATTTAHPRHL